LQSQKRRQPCRCALRTRTQHRGSEPARGFAAPQLELVADRLSNKEIAVNLVISEHTVKNHLKNILGKLHLRSRRQAADYGLARGWVRPADPTT